MFLLRSNEKISPISSLIMEEYLQFQHLFFAEMVLMSYPNLLKIIEDYYA